MRRARGRYASDSPEPKTPEKNPEDVPASPTTPGSMFASMSKSIGRTLAWRGTSTKSKSDDEEVHLDPKTGLPMSPRSLALKRGQYIPPSVDEAVEHRDDVHPRVQGPRGLQPYPLDIGTGDLGVEMGPGIALYFNFLSWMSAAFFVLFLLNFPTIMVANAAKYWGPYSAARNSTGYQAAWDAAIAGDFDLASTTFGSIAPDDVEEGEWLTYEGFARWGYVISISKRHFLYGSCGMDVLGTILFLVVMVFFQRRQKAIVRAVDEDSIEISDYSVTVKGLPEDATDKEEVRCFFELKFGKVVDAVLAKNDGVLVTLYKKRGELAMRHDALHSKFIKTKKGEKPMEKLQEKIAVVDEKIAALKKRRNFKTKLAFVTFSEEDSYVECLNASPRTWLGRWLMPESERFRGTYAYTVEEAPAPTDVMFENLDVSERSRFWRRQLITLITVVVLLLSFSAITALSVMKVRLSLSTAMDPAKLAIAVGGPGGGEFGSPESRAEASEDPSAVTLREDFNGSVAFKNSCAAELAKCEVTYSEVGLLAIMPWGTTLSVVPVAARMSETEKLVKAKSTMNEIVACGADETACSATRAGANETRKCHACYCAGLQYNTHATDGPGHSAGDLAIDDFSDKEIADVREQCDAFLQSPGLFETMLLGVAAAAVTIVNSALKMIIKAISSFERPASFIELQKKVAEKVFVAQFFNTAVSSLVINAALPELVAGIPILSSTVFNGTHRDFDQLWYKQIGGPLMITMLINTVGPIGGNVAAELTGAFSRVVAKYTAWTQRELNEAYTGPEFDIATRYGEVLMCVMVTMMYGSGMPMLYAFACFFCGAISYFDRRFLLRVCRRPPRYGTSLARLAMTVAPWAAFVHLLFGMWMHTHFLTPSVGATTGAGAGYLGSAVDYEDAAAEEAAAFAAGLREGADLDFIVEIAANASEAAAARRSEAYAPIPSEIRRRVMQTNGFPFFFLAVLFVAFRATTAVLAKLWEAIKTFLPCIESLPCFREDAEYEGVPTFEDAYLGDKLVGARTYEMRDMPKYKDFFFEGKAGAGRKKEKKFGEVDPYEQDAPSDEDDDDEDVDMGDIGALLAGGGLGGGGLGGGGVGLGGGGGGAGMDFAGYRVGRFGERGPTSIAEPTPQPVSRAGGGELGANPTRPPGAMPRFGPPASARFGPPR